ncbi:MAG: hypothetical protein J5I41_11280, partial [Saprospiraceae bacterium]|nr:hypothetical protein [Saprospiraceae bacterium]
MPSRIPVVTGWILAGLMLAVQDLAGQPGCQETLQAVPDTTICHPGGTVQLNGLFSGDAQNILEVEWTPAAGLSDPFVLDPLATVNATTTYTLRVRHFTGNNLFANGDFESGNTGFTSDYNHSPANLVPEGVYAITANPSIQHPGFAPCGDHTSGGGNMMAVNGAGTPGLNVWCQTVSVLPNTTYIFSAWVTSLHPSFPAILQFYANGASMGAEFEAPPTTCDWQQYYNLWYSGNATSATFCIVNQNTILGGNDFAMDDIYLSEVCEYEDEVTITVLDQIVEYQSHFLCAGESVEVGGQTFQSSGSYTVVLPSFQGCDSTIVVDVEVLDVEAWILPPEALSCQQNEVTLDGSLSTGSYGVATYQWSTSGGMIISNPQMPSVTVGAAVTYQLLVSTQGPGITCWDSTAVTVVLDTATIGISVLPPEALSCQDSVTTLTAVAPLMPPGAPVEWITPDGLILAGLNTLTPLVQGTGTYTVILTNPLNGCTSEAFAVLTGDTLRPVLAHDPVGAITCRDSAVVLVTRVLSPDSGTIAAWTTPDGLLLAGADSLAPLVGRTGTYTLTVTDTLRGCTASLVLTVGIDTLHPVLSLAAADTLGCREDSLSVLLGIWPDSLPWSVGWTTPDGLLLAGAATPNPVFGAPGTYTASVQNPLNGCRDSASVTVIRHEEPPLALAGPDLVLDCLADSLQPQSLASDQGPGITYRWWFNGNPVDTLLQPWLSQPGSWVLHVTNNQNRCEAFDTLALTDIRAWPDPVIAPPLRLTCTLTAVALDASASDSGHHVLQWTGPQGGIASGASSPSPQITLPGWYVLTLTDTLNHCAG